MVEYVHLPIVYNMVYITM